MIKVAMVAGAVAALGVASGAYAADKKLEAGSLASANNVAAVAAVKAENGSGFAFGSADIANTQLSRHDDPIALGSGKPAVIGSHSYAAAPDEGSLKQGVLNAKVTLSTIEADPQIGGSKLSAGTGNAAQQGDAHDFLK